MDWVYAAAVIRRDGVLLASNIRESTEIKNAYAIMSATILGAAKNITTKCRMGFPKRIIIQAKSGDIIIAEAGSKALLVCLARFRYDPKIMSEDVDRIAQKIEAVL